MLLPQISTPQTGETIVESVRSHQVATETSADIVVVSAEELAATGERSLPRQLAKAAGVWLQETNLGGGSPILQGMSGAQVLLVVDGVRMNDATTRNGVNQMLNGIDPAAVERIEVVRGPRSVLYGSDALGGAVLVWTKRRAPAAKSGDAGLHGALDSTYQSVTEGYSGALTVSGAFEDHGWLAVGGYHNWNELEAGSGEVQNTAYHGESYFGSWVSQLGEGRTLRATTSITRDFDVPRTDRLNPGFGQTQPSNAEFEYAVQDRQRFVLAYEDRHGGAFADVVQARASFRYYNEDRIQRALGSQSLRREHDTTNTVGLGIDLQKALGEHHVLTYGVDVDYDDVDSGRVDENIVSGAITPKVGSFAPGSRFTSTGVFVQDELTSFEPFDVTLGARYSHYAFGFEDVNTGADEDGDFGALSGSLAVGREVADGVRVVGTLAQGFRAPNLSELARDATFFGGTELANPDLDPEKSLYAELALETRKSTWNASVALFHDNVSDAVGSRLINAGGPGLGDETYLRDNVNTVEIWGAFARWVTQVGGAESRWSTEFAAEYTHGQQYDDFVDPSTGDEPFNDQPAQRIPPFHGWVGLTYDVDRGPWDWAELTCQWAFDQNRLSPQDLADPRIDPDGTDGWATLDLDIGGPLGGPSSGSTWTLGLHNLFDEDYRVHGSGFDAPGFGVVVGVRVSR
ncbi:MAG: TonB-dependent receptor [Planctomycetes bacterium]|nr:TonB-dependent receptor [Planctomycetota bacterium]